MPNLTFRTIQADGSNPVQGDFFFPPVDLSNFVDLPALLVIMTRNPPGDTAAYEHNFITINADKPSIVTAGFDEAAKKSSFVARILPNPTSTWIPQVHRIGPGKLKAADNVLGIHTRNKAGLADYYGDQEPGTNLLYYDTIQTTRIFLIYFGSE